MIIHGGEPPFVESPDPRWGAVLSKLNATTYKLQEQTTSFNTDTKEALVAFNTSLTQFLNDVVIPLDLHFNARGAVHGETKSTIGLSKKDNYPTATLTQQQNLEDVLAYVTPQGAKAAFEKNKADNPYVPDLYQRNDAFQFASFFYPDEYATSKPTTVQPVRYFGISPFVAMLINADRLVYSPVSDTGVYQKQLIMLGSPTQNRKSSQLSEVQNMDAYYLPAGWNMVGGHTSAGKAALFKPLADKKIFDFKNSLGMAGNNRNFLLYRGYGSTTHKGLAISAEIIGTTQLKLNHRFFKVNLVESDPTMVDLVTNSYNALVTQIGKSAYSTPVNGSHTYDIMDFVTLQAGQTLRIGGVGLNSYGGISTTLLWNAQDYEIYLHVAIPCTIEKDGQSRYMMIEFMESIIPGTLLSGGMAVIKQLGTLTKDVVNADFSPPANSKWYKVWDRWNINSPVDFPGVVLNSGDVIKARSTKYGIRIKRYPSGFAGLKAWLQGPRPTVNVKEARTEIFAPSRHSPFGAIPERIVPVTHGSGTTQYLVYGLDNERGRYRWREFTWASDTIAGATVSGKFGITAPSTILPNNNLESLPSSLSLYSPKGTGGVAINALGFTTANGYKGNASFAYANGALALGAVISLSPASLALLGGVGRKVLVSAKTLNPAVNDSLRALQIQVFALTANKAVVVISDGLSYAEGMVVGYTIADNLFSLTVPVGGFVTQPVTPASNSVPGRYRASFSGDDVAMNYSDMLASQDNATTYQVSITRPFGAVYGDLSFTITNFSSANPTLTRRSVNYARLYEAIYQIDSSEELHPPVMIPGKGVYQLDPASPYQATLMKEVGGTLTVDPHDINEAGWVNIPAGSKVVIRGRAYILDRDYPIKVNPTGVTYCYLQRLGNTLVGVGSSVIREVSNSEVMFGTATNGVLEINHSYLVLDNHLVTPLRRGSAVPTFDDNGGTGTNQFFTRRDLI